MPSYYVYSNEHVFYCTIVEADSEKEAMQKVREGKIDTGDIIDGEDFEVDFAELVE